MARLEPKFTRKSKVQAQVNTMMVFDLILTLSLSGLEKNELRKCKIAWALELIPQREQTA